MGGGCASFVLYRAHEKSCYGDAYRYRVTCAAGAVITAHTAAAHITAASPHKLINNAKSSMRRPEDADRVAVAAQCGNTTTHALKY